MKRFVLVLLSIVIAMTGFLRAQAVSARRISATTESGELERTMGDWPGRVGRPARKGSLPAAVAGEVAAAPSRGSEEIWQRIHEGSAGTYIDEILVERDSSLARWSKQAADPLRVWVGTGTGLRNWDSTHVGRVRDAVREWSSAGVPIQFTFVTDSADAEVRVTWTDHFAGRINGKTVWARDRHWWIVKGTITIALHHDGGEVLSGNAIKAIALHEVGHVLGLDHTMDTTNIMTPKVRVRELSEADRATLRLLYSLPPGSLVNRRVATVRNIVVSIPEFLQLLF